MQSNDTPTTKSIPENRKPYWSDDHNSYVVNLTQGHVALIDEDDAVRIGEYRWFAQNHPSGIYAATGSSRKRERISMAAFIMNPDHGMVVDHRNHNTLDNRKANLRICSRRENGMNRKGVTARNKSGYLGVTFEKFTGKWKAAIKVNGRARTIGRFNTVDEAVLARDIAALKHYGEFARLNIRDLTT